MTTKVTRVPIGDHGMSDSQFISLADVKRSFSVKETVCFIRYLKEKKKVIVLIFIY